MGLAVLAVAPCRSVHGEEILEPNVRIERTLESGGVHTFGFGIAAGQFARVTAEQNHVDLVIRILSPDGSILAAVDNAADRSDPLSLSFVAAHDGGCRVQVLLRSAAAVGGRYALAREAPRTPTDADRKRIAAEAARREADRLLVLGTAGSLDGAVEGYERVVAAWHELGDSAEEAATLLRLSDALSKRSELRAALMRAEEGLALYRVAGSRRGEAAALNKVGLAHAELGEPKRGLEILREAMALRRADGDVWGQAETFNDMAVAFGVMGRLPEAVARYTDALALAHAIGDRLGEALILKNRATDHVGLGETDRGLADLKDALVRFRAMGNRHEEGVTLFGIANILLDRNEPAEALRTYERAVAILKETGDRRFEGFARHSIGLAHLATGMPKAALGDFEHARNVFESCGDRRGEAMALANSGRALLETGDARGARNRLREALRGIRLAGDQSHEAEALYFLARAERALLDLESARAHLEAATRLTESLRGSIPSVGERAAFVARIHERYDLLVDVLMALHAKTPGAGLDAEALHVSERAKARSLVDLLTEARVDLREGVDERLLEAERSLELQIDAARREEQRRLAGENGRSPSDPDRRSLGVLLEDYEELEGRLRAASPRFAALARPRPLSLKEIRETVLDDATLLLEYSLGAERSFVWAATRETLVSRELPKRAVVEAAARRLYEAWSAGNAVDAAEVERRALALSRMILGPVADQLGARRLAIVADGALRYLPFAALPLPDKGHSEPLVATHEVVSLPSATTLSVLRRETVARRRPGSRIAVLADPVFDRHDPRVLGGRATAGPDSGAMGDALTRSMKETGLSRLDRLAASRKEAEAIATLAGPGGSWVALDFRASRAAAMGEDVSSARVVHFASHALLNSRHPELSGVVLSLVDEHGRPQDGFLQTRDVYRLKLAADLVVLSACQTALGKDVRGEGLVGLSRGFMYAGAPSIVASLWPVPDRATSELMKHFYEGILRKGLRPAAALRSAQMAIRREKRWTTPYFWAAFTAEGDWN